MRTRAFTKNVSIFLVASLIALTSMQETIAQCTSSFTITPGTCNVITVYDSSTAAAGDAIDWIDVFWGDGFISSNLDPVDFPLTHTYGSPGTYTYLHVIHTVQGCVDSASSSVIISGPIANFTTTPVCNGYPTLFFDLSSPNGGPFITSWDWDFGDGGISSAQNPAHTYTTAGTYMVCLTVTNADGRTNTYCSSVEVYPNPIADFTYVPDCDYEVMFTDLSIPNALGIVTWNWSFGDGGASSVQHPTHTYASAGTYTVCLIVTNTNGCIDSICYEVSTSLGAGAGLVADLIAPDTTYVGVAVDFIDNSTVCDANIISWEWDFGDPASGILNTSNLQDPSHTYASGGTYEVTLLVLADSLGTILNDTAFHTIVVIDGSPVYPIADFSFSYNCLNQPVDFLDLSTTNGGSALTNWYWDFGDGGSSTVQNPSYTYASAGTYNISLVVTNADNLSDTAVNSITLDPLPGVTASAVPNSTMPGDTIQFNGSSNSAITSWTWTFGDGSTSIMQNPLHSYQYAGNYTVSLTVTDIAGCMSTTSIPVYIYVAPSFPDDSSIWNTVGDNSITSQTWRFRYGLLGDTTISATDQDTLSYSKVYSLFDSTLTNPNSTYFAALRETEDKEVYALLPGFEEGLLYDFNLEVGDTIWYAIGGSLCYNSVSFTDEDHYKVVTATDSILLVNGETRKRWHLTDHPNGIMNDVWVEGIGSVVWYGLFNPFITDITLCGDSYSFACMKEGDEVIYLSNPYCEECFCQLMTTVNENDLAEADPIHIYPNPANDHLVIESTEMIEKLRIIDITGNVAKEKQVGNLMIRIPVMDLTNGVYLIELQSSRKQYQKKLIIQHR